MRASKNVLLVRLDDNLAAILEKGLRKGGYRVSTMLGTRPPRLKWAIRENIAAIGNLDKKGRTALQIWSRLGCGHSRFFTLHVSDVAITDAGP